MMSRRPTAASRSAMSRAWCSSDPTSSSWSSRPATSEARVTKRDPAVGTGSEPGTCAAANAADERPSITRPPATARRRNSSPPIGGGGARGVASGPQFMPTTRSRSGGFAARRAMSSSVKSPTSIARGNGEWARS